MLLTFFTYYSNVTLQESLFTAAFILAFLAGLLFLFIYKIGRMNGDCYQIKKSFLFLFITIICVIVALTVKFVPLKNEDNANIKYANATIIAVEERTSRTVIMSGTVPVIIHKPKFEVKYTFVAEDGVTYGGKDIVTSNPGNSLEIRYNPDDPIENDIP